MKAKFVNLNEKYFDWSPEGDILLGYITQQISKIKMEEVTNEDLHKVERLLIEDEEFMTALRKVILINF